MSQKKLSTQTRKTKTMPILGFVFLLVAILLSIALASYQINQDFFFSKSLLSSFVSSSEISSANLIGKTGALASVLLFFSFGLSSIILCLFLFSISYMCFFGYSDRINWIRITSISVCLLSLCAILTLSQTYVSSCEEVASLRTNFFQRGWGGVFGELLYFNISKPLLNDLGSLLVIIPIYAISFCLAFFVNPLSSVKDFLIYFKDLIIGKPLTKEERLQKLEQKQEDKRLKEEMKKEKEEAIFRKKEDSIQKKLEKLNKKKLSSSQEDELEEDKSKSKNQRKVLFSQKNDDSSKLDNIDELKNDSKSIFKNPFSSKDKNENQDLKVQEAQVVEKSTAKAPKKKGNYLFPTSDLLNEPKFSYVMSHDEHMAVMDNLVRVLSQFKIEVTPAEVCAGPVVTRYEVVPASGVKLEKISALGKNIALGLKALAVRIIAPVPGKGTVGVEIPNAHPQAVSMREIIESNVWNNNDSQIPVVLGKDVTGKPIVLDLAKMPHALIAGSTGSGKSVCINAIIASILYHCSPEDVRFIMVDPKVVEMQQYNSLPHMLIPVVTRPEKVPHALKWLIKEMERRYIIFGKKNVKNIAGFNAKILKDKEELEKARELETQLTPEERVARDMIEASSQDEDIDIPKTKLPYIVCIIDELADLMMVAKADVETAIARLTQLARAAGIHLIVATQRPSTDVVTGLIKANLPTRIAFRTTSGIDSRTILDSIGAESLLGKGDMLFVPPGSADLVRAQGAFMSDEEIGKIIEFEKQNGEPEYSQEVQDHIDNAGEDSLLNASNEEWDDKLIPQALEIIQTTKRTSISNLQRKLSIGYNRAARIMDILEEKGYVSSPDDKGNRELLM